MVFEKLGLKLYYLDTRTEGMLGMNKPWFKDALLQKDLAN